MSDWQKLNVRAPKSMVNLISDWLTAYGALAVTVTAYDDEEIFQPEISEVQYWGDNLISSLFTNDFDLSEYIADIYREFPELDQNFVNVEKLQDKNWVLAWQKYFKTIKITEKFYITPSHETPKDNVINLMLDPGMAFGTGAHATTQLCLQWLATNDLTDKTIIDYGTGSGILAIAGLLLDAKNAIGVDIDPGALTVAEENAIKNNIENNKFKCYLPENTPPTTADIVIANILLNPLLQLKSTLIKLIADNGILLLSGILLSQKEQLILHFADTVTCIFESSNEDWVILGFKKNV